ncbi:UTP20 [Sanghuangporus sanghuang]
MVDNRDEDGHRTKRFKYQSYNEQLKEVHAPSPLDRSKVDEALVDEECLFHASLSHWMQLNLSPSFISFAQKVSPLSQSLTLLVHSWREVTELWLSCVRGAEDEAMKALLDLFQKLVEDIRTTLYPAYESIISCLFDLLMRRRSPEVLTALLASLTSVFKYVMIPSVPESNNTDVLSTTWTYLSTTLVKCNSEVQRAVAEVWSSVLRRLRKGDQQQCVGLMMVSARELNDFVTWSFVFTAKSVAQTIHTSGPLLISSCLNYHLVASDDELEASAKLLRRILTALIHHCKKAEQFSIIAEPLILKFAETTDVECSKRMLELLIVPCTVRQGSRLTPKQVSAIIDATIKLPLTTNLRNAVLTLTTAALSASSADLSIWMGGGRRVIEHAWSVDAQLAVSLTGSLLEVGWKGFSQFALSPFLKKSLDLLASEDTSPLLQLQILRVLAKLAKSGMLKNVDELWRSRLADWIRVWIGQFTISEDSVIMLAEMIALMPMLSSYNLIPPLISLVQRIIDNEADAETEYSTSWANETQVFGQLIYILSTNKHKSLLSESRTMKIICTGIRRWSWSEHVLEGIAELAKSRLHSRSEIIQDRDIVLLQLTRNVNSHSHIIRRSSLELLSLPGVAPESTMDAVKRCLAAELVPLSVQGVKERVLLTGKVGQIAVDDEQATLICGNWLLGQLKVGLRPIWAPAGQALANLAQRFPDVVWSIVYPELKDIDAPATAGTVPVWASDTSQEEDAINEQERSWRDPSAHKFRVALAKWTSVSSCRIALIEQQKPRERYDARSYETQLLASISEFPSVAEKHSRELVPLLLSVVSSASSEKASRSKLVNWLKLFAKFSNPKAFYQSNKVHALFVSLLSHPDRSLQSSALSCLQTYKTPALVSKSDILKNLLDDIKWRDEITMLDLKELSPDERDEIVPVLVRLFYGMMRERGGSGKGMDRRAALLGALAACTEDELALLVELMVEPFRERVNSNVFTDGDRTWTLGNVDTLAFPEKQQIGFLMLLADVLRILGTQVEKSWPQLVAVSIALTAHAQRTLNNSAEDAIVEEAGNGNEDEKEGDEEDAKLTTRSVTRLRQLRLIRQLGLKRFAEFFRLRSQFDFSPYMAELYRSVISPRIPLLDRENTQAPSSLLELLHVWSMQPDTAEYFVQYDQRTLTKVFDCLVATNVKPAVQVRIFDMLENLLAFASEDATFSDRVVKPYMSRLLENVATAVERSTVGGSVSAIGGIAQREIAILSRLSPYIVDGSQAATLLSIFLPQLRRTGKGIPEKSKVDMLNTICYLVPQIYDFTENRIPLFSKTYETLAYLFQSLRGRQARITLIGAFTVLTGVDPSLTATARLLASFNSYSTTRIDEPDFDRRLTAFATLNEEQWKSLSAREWSPFLQNMLCFIQDEDELTIRTNASLSMKRFLEALSIGRQDDLQLCFVRILFPGLKRGLRSKSDLVRGEVMGVLSFAVEKCSNVNALQEMRVLLANGDEEANFFNNIFHIQVHRRTRALRRLAEFCDQPGFRSSTLQEIFVPVVNSFIRGPGTTDHHLVNEAITTLGRIAMHLAWPAYFALVQQYIRLMSEKNSSERTYTRALVSVLDNFHFAMEDTFAEEAEEDGEGDDVGPIETKAPSVTMKIHDAVINRLLPTLLKHLEQRDELEDTNRIPLAIGITKVSLHLPEASRDIQVSRLLTILSQVFRSKSQETRDVTRETLCRIAIMLGPSYLPVIIRQLREALIRGPHLHVLAYVTHAILVHVTRPEDVAVFDTLDGCVPDVVHVSSEVVFGESKKDVESEGFKTKMKEVKGSSSKSIDSFAILAKYVTPSATSSLLLPIKGIMQETESVKMMQVVEEVLRRMAVGLNANKHFGAPELLVFCHTLVSQNARFFQESTKVQKRRAKKINDVNVLLKRKIEPENDHYAHNSWRFVVFGLDLFNTAYRRGHFDLKDASILSRLEPMVNVIGNTLYSSTGSVVSFGLKAVAQIVKAPLENVKKNLPIFVRQTLQIVRETGSTEADVVQAAFKTLAVIIRDVSSSQLKEKDLTFLLELLTPDLEEVTRQANAFALLRAIVYRKFIVPEIYDLMDRVGEIMVTSQSPQVQELCRSVLLQFMLEYPQGKNRLKQQFAFLIKNLSYVFESGRKSVLEFLSAIIMKFTDDIIAEYADMLFVSLVLVIANDDSTKCREMASQLVKLLLERLGHEQQPAIVSHVHSWAAQQDSLALARVSSQLYGLILDALKLDARSYLTSLLDDVNDKVRTSAISLEAFDEGVNEETGVSDSAWQIPYQALLTLSKVFLHFPYLLSEHDKVAWSSVSSLLLHPHAWVRTASSRLFGTLFSVAPVRPPDEHLTDDFPLSLYGMRGLANAFSLQLKSENLDQGLALQIVKNLFYVGKCFYAIPLPEADSGKKGMDVEDSSDESDSESEKDHDTNEITANRSHPLPWLFSRLSYQARSAYIFRINNPIQKNWWYQPRAVFQWFAAMASHMDSAQLARFLPHILGPLYRFAEDDLIRDPAINDLKTLTSELQDLLQTKVGVTTFAQHYSRIRQRVTYVRQERKVTRVLRKTVDPKSAAERKLKRNIGKRKREREKIGDLK